MTMSQETWESGTMLDALERLRDTGLEYNGFLANHGPMAADAMIRLGGGPEVSRWVEMYRPNVSEAARLGSTVTDENWREHLGRIERVGDWIGYFRGRVADVEWPALLSTWWPRLLPGGAASATHGLIRTAHAVRVLADTHDDQPLMLEELASGLALWAARYQSLPGDPHLNGTLDAADAIAQLPRLDARIESAGPGVGGRLGSLVELDTLPQALEVWGPKAIEASTFDDLIGVAARVVAARDDNPIAYCHAVTAPAAVRMILPHVPREHLRATLAACWQMAGGLIAAFADPADPDETVSPHAPVPDPAELAQSALAHGDEHVIKLTEACIRQHGVTNDPALLIAADRFRGRVEPRW